MCTHPCVPRDISDIVTSCRPSLKKAFLIFQNGLEECCKAVAKRQIDGDELLVSEREDHVEITEEEAIRAIFRFRLVSVTTSLAAVPVDDPLPLPPAPASRRSNVYRVSWKPW